jgi:hypothetical protein
MLTAAIALAVTAPAVTVSKYKSFDTILATAVATSPVGTQFAVASEDNRIRIIDAKTMNTTFQLLGHPMTVYGLTFSNDGRYLLSGDESARIYLWDTRTGKKVREFPRTKGHTRGIQSIAVSQNDRQFATVGKDDVIKVWNMSGGDPIKTIEGKGANFYGISYLPNGSIATGTLAEGVRLYTNKYDLAAKLSVDQGANDLALNAAGSMGLTANRNGSVTLWNISKREKVATMPGHTDWVLGVAIAPNGKIAASSSTDSSVVIWDLKTYKKVATIGDRAYVDSLVAFTADGKYLLTTDAGNALQVFQVSPPQK